MNSSSIIRNIDVFGNVIKAISFNLLELSKDDSSYSDLQNLYKIFEKLQFSLILDIEKKISSSNYNQEQSPSKSINQAINQAKEIYQNIQNENSFYIVAQLEELEKFIQDYQKNSPIIFENDDMKIIKEKTLIIIAERFY